MSLGVAPAERTWWLARRRAGPVDAFRVACGVMLAVAFARHCIETVPLLAGTGLFDPSYAPPALGVRASWLVQGAPSAALYALFGTGALLGIAVAAGVRARASSLLLLALCVLTNWAILPVTYVDDNAACVASLLVATLPAGPAMRPPWRRDRRDVPIDGTSMTALLVLVALFYLSGALGDLCGVPPGAAGAVTIVSRLLPVLFVTPSRILQTIGVATQLALHAYLSVTTPALFTNVVLASTCFAFSGDAREDDRPAPVLGGGGVAAAAIVALGAFALVAGGRAIGAGARRLLVDLTLVPVEAHLPARSGAAIVVSTSADQGAARARELPLAGLRSAILAARLSDADRSGLRLAVAAGLARKRCRDPESWAQSGTVRVGDDDGVDFGCDVCGGLSAVKNHGGP